MQGQDMLRKLWISAIEVSLTELEQAWMITKDCLVCSHLRSHAMIIEDTVKTRKGMRTRIHLSFRRGEWRNLWTFRWKAEQFIIYFLCESRTPLTNMITSAWWISWYRVHWLEGLSTPAVSTIERLFMSGWRSHVNQPFRSVLEMTETVDFTEEQVGRRRWLKSLLHYLPIRCQRDGNTEACRE